MDLTPYTCRGFPGDFDRLMRDVPVAGIDRAQTHAMVRLCDETEPILYGPDFSPRAIRFVIGTRPYQELVTQGLRAKRIEHRVAAAMRWTHWHVVHPNLIRQPLPPNRGATEQEIIASGRGWCNEQSRVFIALCEVMEVPAQLCFLFHANGRTGHTATEVLLGGKWAMHDITYNIRIELPDGSFAEARDLRGKYRHHAHPKYTAPLKEYYRDQTPPFDLDRGGDFFETIGITNYLIDGCEPVNQHDANTYDAPSH